MATAGGPPPHPNGRKKGGAGPEGPAPAVGVSEQSSGLEWVAVAGAAASPQECWAAHFEQGATFLGLAEAVWALVVALLVAGFCGRIGGHFYDDCGSVDDVGVGDPLLSVALGDFGARFGVFLRRCCRSAPLLPVLLHGVSLCCA